MFLLLYLVSITIASQSHDNIQGQIKITDNYPTSIKEIDWGTGYNSVKLTRTYNEPVDVKMPVSAYKGFIELSYKIELCKTREEFQKFHSGGISVAASYMGVEGSADISFLTETTITSLDSVLVTSVIAITDTSRIDSAELKKEAKALLEQEQYERFVEMYGTHFLRKVLLGGKMVLVMTFSSRSTKEKNELDAKLKVIAGPFETDDEYKRRMESIKEFSSTKVSVYASGSDTDLPSPDIEACMKYTLDYAKSVRANPAVRDVEYTALWNLPSAPAGLKNYITPLQAHTDTIVDLTSTFLDIESRIIDYRALKGSDLAFFSPEAWKQLNNLETQVESSRRSVQNKFKTANMENFPDIIKEHSGIAEKITKQIDDIVAKEKKLGDSFILRSSGLGSYISTDKDKYPRVDQRNPFPLKFANVAGPTQAVKFGATVFAHDFSNPARILCMKSGSNYVQWGEYEDRSSSDKCRFRLAHATDTHKSTLEYGDKILLYNIEWPDYIAGVSNDREWVKSRDADEAGDPVHQWILERGH